MDFLVILKNYRLCDFVVNDIKLKKLIQAFISEPLVLPNWLDVHGVRPGEVVDEAEGHQPHHDDQYAPVRLPRTGSAAARTGRGTGFAFGEAAAEAAAGGGRVRRGRGLTDDAAAGHGDLSVNSYCRQFEDSL